MEKIKFVFNDEAGLHARPAGNLVKIASKFESSILIKKNGNYASAKGLFGVMGLSVRKGDNVEIEIEGDDENQAKKSIEKFLEENSAEILTETSKEIQTK